MKSEILEIFLNKTVAVDGVGHDGRTFFYSGFLEQVRENCAVIRFYDGRRVILDVSEIKTAREQNGGSR